jgi:hypothetical protein
MVAGDAIVVDTSDAQFLSHIRCEQSFLSRSKGHHTGNFARADNRATVALVARELAWGGSTRFEGVGRLRRKPDGLFSWAGSAACCSARDPERGDGMTVGCRL